MDYIIWLITIFLVALNSNSIIMGIVAIIGWIYLGGKYIPC